MEVKLCCVKTVFAKSRYERCKYKKNRNRTQTNAFI